MSNGAPKFTNEQRRAIETVGRNLLISAAAGSGKTAVLAERCAHLVCDASSPHRCEVDQLLVVTFTNAAANEMRTRIGRALRQRLGDRRADDADSARKMALIDRAHISTLHGFCSWLLRQHFSVAGIDPNFATLADDEAVLLRNEVARDLFADRYQTDESGEFQQFIDCYGNGDDELLAARVVQTHGLLCSMIDRERWIDRAQARVREAVERPLSQSEMGKELLELIRQRLVDYYGRCKRGIDLLQRLGRAFEGYVDAASELMAAAESWLARVDIDALSAAMQSAPKPRLGPIPNDTPGKKRAMAIVDDLRGELKSGGALYELLRFDTAQWQDGLRKTVVPTRIFLELVSEFARRYEAAKREIRAVDFADLENLALSLLRDPNEPDRLAPSAIARSCRSQFWHVLVDEYQDINAVQDAILSLVSCDAAQDQAASQNLFCVGDVKQSIYGFRLAEPARFIDRAARFHNDETAGLVIDLQKNFRSRQPLLGSINEVFRRLMTREAAELEYDKSQELVFGAEYPSSDDDSCFKGAPIELHLLPKPERAAAASDETTEETPDRTEREAAFVAQRIRQLMGLDSSPRKQVCMRNDDGTTSLRPIEFRDIVILLRSMKVKSDDFAEQLRGAGLPVHSESAVGFFEAIEVRDMLALLRLLDNQRQDVPMAAVLRSPLASLPDPDDSLSGIRLAYPDRDGAMPFHQAVVRYANEKKDELSAKLRIILDQLREWRAAAHRQPLAELIWQIYDQTGYLAFCAGLQNGQQRVANLIALHERARQFGNFERQGLARFMEFLRTLEKESDLGQASIASQADDVVRIMSIHRAKGLEFPVVFLCDLGKKHNLQDSVGTILADRSAYLGMQVVDEERQIRYPSLASTLVSQRLRRKSLAEELRVLYVAMTRAREHLILVGTCAAEAPEKWRDAWRDHNGPLPADQVLCAGTMLDWLGPVTAAIAGEHPDAFGIQTYDQEQVTSWITALSKPAELSARQKERAKLIPLDPPPAADPLADEVLARANAKYEFDELTTVSAAQAVTRLTKGSSTPTPATPVVAQAKVELALPKFVIDTRSPVEVGAATHLVLQHLDFSVPTSRDQVQKQIDRLIDRRMIDPRAAGLADIEGIVWLMTSELGEILRSNASQRWRELALSFAGACESSAQRADALDCVMIRGRIDVLISRGSKLVIADYKTDNVKDAAGVEQRVEIYRPQMLAYRDAIERITGRSVEAAYLAFLTPRILRSMA